MTRLLPIYDNLNAYETLRYRLENEDGGTIGYVSRYYTDGRTSWVAWRDDGLRQQTHTRHAAIVTLEQSAV